MVTFDFLIVFSFLDSDHFVDATLSGGGDRADVQGHLAGTYGSNWNNKLNVCIHHNLHTELQKKS